MDKISVIKIGGNIIDDEHGLQRFLRRFSQIDDPKILVHGGGKVATRVGSALGLIPNYLNGRRITDAATLELITMVYGGLLNKKIVSGLQAKGCNAIGLSGCDGQAITARRRPVYDLDYGFVGDIHPGGINVPLLQLFLEAGMVPVLAPLTYDGEAGLLNTNADTIAQEVAIALSHHCDVQLIYCFEKKGLLRDPSNDDSVIPDINEAHFHSLVAEGVISDGMIPKLENAFRAISQGLQKVIIGSAEDLKALIAGTAGTQVL